MSLCKPVLLHKPTFSREGNKLGCKHPLDKQSRKKKKKHRATFQEEPKYVSRLNRLILEPLEFFPFRPFLSLSLPHLPCYKSTPGDCQRWHSHVTFLTTGRPAVSSLSLLRCSNSRLIEDHWAVGWWHCASTGSPSHLHSKHHHDCVFRHIEKV